MRSGSSHSGRTKIRGTLTAPNCPDFRAERPQLARSHLGRGVIKRLVEGLNSHGKASPRFTTVARLAEPY